MHKETTMQVAEQKDALPPKTAGLWSPRFQVHQTLSSGKGKPLNLLGVEIVAKSPRVMSSGTGHVSGSSRPQTGGEIWNQFTYSSEHFRLFTRMRMVEKRSAMLGVPPSEYIERMSKAH